jgi:hypothetical protein
MSRDLTQQRKSKSYTESKPSLSHTTHRCSVGHQFLFPEWSAITNIKVVPELRSDDADMILLMVTKNLIRYRNPVNDPFFAAHRPFLSESALSGEKPTYLSDWPNSCMGCRQQVCSEVP